MDSISIQRTHPKQKKVENKYMGRIGIIGAMEEEVALLKEKMEIEVIVKKASMEFYQGTLMGRECVVVRSGIGKVNAGLCAQILVDVFNVSHLINTGIAGSLKAEINIGDIVVSSDAFGKPLMQFFFLRIKYVSGGFVLLYQTPEQPRFSYQTAAQPMPAGFRRIPHTPLPQ